MRYVDLDAHADTGLGLDEFEGPARFTRPCERIPSPVDSSHVQMGDPSGMDLVGMFDAIEAGRRSGDDIPAAGNVAGVRNVTGADVIRAEALASLEARIAHAWSVWEGLTEGQSRDNLARFIHDLEDRADALTEGLDRGNTTPATTDSAKNRVTAGESTTQKEK
ncbi:UNVERIFIED_ORG: hypothetical protein L601_000800000480 [Gordonia westfalica J30]